MQHIPHSLPLCFHPTPYLSADDEVVKLWDLRKLKNFKTISLEDKYTVRSLTFDNSGHYLAVAGPDVRLYQIRFVGNILCDVTPRREGV